MKPKNPVALLIAWLGLAVAPTQAVTAAEGTAAHASPRQTGTVAGRVQNGATGQYLNNARVSVKGTEIVVFTDQAGYYRLVQVPSGPVVLEVFYTGLDPQQIPLTLNPDGTVEQNLSLTSVARYGQDTGIVKLDQYKVAENREMEAEALAINEQRFAANVKNVLSTDAFGEVVGGTMGDFLKFIPGVNVEYAGNNVTKVSVRGLGYSLTSLTTDGVPMVSTTTDQTLAAGRAFNMGMSDFTDLSRIEVTKAPTPSTPADSIGGSVNMVSKSAFDRDRPQFRYSVGLLGNAYALTLRKTPDSWGDKKTYKVWPLLAFDYTLPLTKNFGLMFTGLAKKQAEPAHTTNAMKTYTTVSAGTGASISKPFLSNFQKLGGARSAEQYSLYTKADWRALPNAVLSFGVKWSHRDRLIGDGGMIFNTGTNGVPVPATGVPLSFGDDFTIGATGRGAVTIDARFQQFISEAITPTLTVRFDDGTWKVDGSASYTKSTIYMRLTENGPMRTTAATMAFPVRVEFSKIDADRPEVRVFNNNNQPVDFNDLNNYVMSPTGTTTADYEREVRSEFIELKVRRRLLAFPFPSSLEVGGARHNKTYDNDGITSTTYTYAGPTGTGGPATPYAAQVFVGEYNRGTGYLRFGPPGLTCSAS